MKLHESKDDFSHIIGAVKNRTGIREDILEKDYYVCLFLQEIAEKQADVKMYFKGGTALYKITDEPRRFSEDIDLTVDVRGLSNTQAKKHLERASQKLEALPRLKGDAMEENNKGSITAVYGYTSAFGSREDALQRFGKVKVEATSFTVSEPVSTYNVSSMLYKYADENERKILDNVSCSPINIQAISLERMFADKLLAAEFYLERNNLFDVAKHVYDIHVLMSDKKIQEMLSNDQSIINYLSYKRIEERNRIGSDLADKPLKDLMLFSSLIGNGFEQEFTVMQNIYVFDQRYRVGIDEAVSSLDQLKLIMADVSDEEQQFLKSKKFRNMVNNYSKQQER